MKTLILTLMALFLVIQVNAQNYKKIEPYIEAITKYEKFAAKAVDDYSISIYQDTRKEGVRETLIAKLKEDKQILTTHKFSVNNDASYTEGLVDFIDLLTEYFEKNVGEFNIEQDATTIGYEELENRFKDYNVYADKIEQKFIGLIHLKESFAINHGMPIKIEYGRDLYKNQFFRYCGKFIEIIAKIDFADIKLQNAIASKNSDEMKMNYEKLQDYLIDAKVAVEKLGMFKENNRMYLQINSYIDAYFKFQNLNKSKIDLIQKSIELKSYAATNNKDEYYNIQVDKYNNDRKILLEMDTNFFNEKSNLVITYSKEMNEFQREHLELLIDDEVKIKNTLYTNKSVSYVEK
jgi:hypothetical protein